MKARILAALLTVLALFRSADASAIAGIGPTLISKPPAAAHVGPPVAGYSWWLDATYASNTTTKWFDQGAHGYNVIPSTGVVTLTPAAVNGLQAYLFNGAIYMTTGATTIPAEPTVTVFAVVHPTSFANSRPGVIDAGYSTQYDLNFGSSTGIEFYVNGSRVTNGSSPTVNTTYVLAAVYDTTNPYSGGAGQVAFINNSDVAGQAASTWVPTATNRLVGYWSVVGQGFIGYICEIIEYPSALTAAQITTVYNYLNAKWG